MPCWTPRTVAARHHSASGSYSHLFFGGLCCTYQCAFDSVDRGASRRYGPGTTHIAILPFYHIYGMIVVLYWSLYIGAKTVVLPKFLEPRNPGQLGTVKGRRNRVSKSVLPVLVSKAEVLCN